MEYAVHDRPENPYSIGVLGYIIVINKQVHSYQVDALSDYLNYINLNIDDTVLADIIDGKDTAISFEDSLEALSHESDEIRHDICYMLLLLSQLDNVIDEKENSLITEVLLKTCITEETKLNLINSATKDAAIYRKVKNSLFENEFMKSKHSKMKQPSKHFKKTKRSIDDENYIDMIKRCEDIAKEDFDVVRPCYKSIITQNQECLKAIESIEANASSANELSECVEKLINVFSTAVREKIITQTEQAGEMLDQKERTLPDFTITFLGRTKAGKSTLHAILTKTGYDKIGAGRQRTTRYNRVYQWNLIRLIDTPGIGSAEAEGRSDDEIAESVLGETDVICLVVADDSILKDILDLMDKAALYNKPIIILLNHKENIRNEIRYKRFISNPSKWATNTGETNLQGHIDRINKYAEDKGYRKLVKPYKVFLLAARMASEVESETEKMILWENSGIEPFISDLKELIAYAGTIKRSQTIIDEAVQKIQHLSDDLILASQPIDKHIKTLEKLREKTIKTLKLERDVTAKRIKDVILEKGTEIANEKSKQFARMAYDNFKKADRNDVSSKWDEFIIQSGIKDDLATNINTEINNYVAKADTVIKELFDDISFSIANEFNVSGVKIPLNIDFKQIFRICNLIIGSEAIALGVLSIFFPFLAIVEAIVFAKWIIVDISTLFARNRYEKKEAYIRRVHKIIRRKVLKASKEQARTGSKCAKEEINKQIDKIDNVFEELIESLKGLSEQATIMEESYKKQSSWLNKVYAWRIIQFLKNRTDAYSEDSVNNIVESVYRINNTIYIGTARKNHANTECLKDVLADRIDFV
ncbi:MAG: 50S ribosome-binding GTPase [Clostridiales bacterium]|nr:50S ribosome-binding GTPase [Clostridiales bacterium]